MNGVEDSASSTADWICSPFNSTADEGAPVLFGCLTDVIPIRTPLLPGSLKLPFMDQPADAMQSGRSIRLGGLSPPCELKTGNVRNRRRIQSHAGACQTEKTDDQVQLRSTKRITAAHFRRAGAP